MAVRLRRSASLVLAVGLMASGVAVAAPAFAIDAPGLPEGVEFANSGTLVDPEYELSIDCAALPNQAEYEESKDFWYLYLPMRANDTVIVDVENCDSMVVGVENTDETRVVPFYRFLDGADAGVTRTLGVDFESGDSVAVTRGSIEMSTNLYLELLGGMEISKESTEEIAPESAEEVLPEPTDEVVPQEVVFDPNYFIVATELAVEVANPVGSLLRTVDLSIPADATADMVVGDREDYYDADEEYWLLGGLEECSIIAGDHIAATTTFTADRTGTYTFRLADLDPVSNDIDQFQPIRYLTDPFAALYRTYTPADAHAGLVGCNDDSDLDPSYYYITSTGTMMSPRYSQFTVDLQPGTYTLVLTAFDAVSEFDVSAAPAAAPGDFAPGDFAPAAKGEFSAAAFGEVETGSIEVWFAPAPLPETGPTASTGLAFGVGAALIALGAAVLLVRRRAS